MNERRFFIAPFMKNGSPVLIIRTTICNREDMRQIIEDILRDGKKEIRAIVSFRDPLIAKVRLKEIGILPDSIR